MNSNWINRFSLKLWTANKTRLSNRGQKGLAQPWARGFTRLSNRGQKGLAQLWVRGLVRFLKRPFRLRTLRALSPVLRFIICVQLVLYPVYSFPQPPTTDLPLPKDSVVLDKHLSRSFLKGQVETAEGFNKKVESLMEHIFGPHTPSEHYKDHPLDFYSLIHQKVEQSTAGFWERNYALYKETKWAFGQAGKGLKRTGSALRDEAGVMKEGVGVALLRDSASYPDWRKTGEVLRHSGKALKNEAGLMKDGAVMMKDGAVALLRDSANFSRRTGEGLRKTGESLKKINPFNKQKIQDQIEQAGEYGLALFDSGDGYAQQEEERREQLAQEEERREQLAQEEQREGRLVEQSQEEPQNQIEQAEESKEQDQSPPKPTKPFFTEINPENLVVNITSPLPEGSLLEQSADSKEITWGRINSQGDKITGLFPRPSPPYLDVETYAGRSYAVPEEERLYSFNISYQGQVLHRFSNNIQWISFLGPYLVFMEPSRVYEKKAELSFIDLAYFHSAIGKTALPVFHIPIALKSKKQRSALFHPAEIDIRSESLVLTGQNGHTETFTQKQISDLSHIQQVSFNVLVSMLSAKRYERDMVPFLQEIVNTLESTLREQEKTIPDNNTAVAGTKKMDQQSKAILRRVSVEILNNRVDLGSPSHHTGHYGALKATQHRIKPVVDNREALLSAITKAEEARGNAERPDPETERVLEESRQKLAQLKINNLDTETYHRSISHLEKDQQFQQALGALKEAKFGRRKLGDRLKALWVYLTLPQPLGAPKIQQALGLMAGSVRKTERVEDRFLMFEEGLKQALAHPKTRLVGLAVLAGMGGFVAPEVADFFKGIFQFTGRNMGVWGVALGDMMTQYLPAFVNPAEWSRAYVQEGKLGPTVMGVGSLMTACILAYYVFHFPINLKKFVDYLRTEKHSHHQNEARFYINRLFSLSHFRDFIQRMEKQYYRDLSMGEFKKLGLPVGFAFPNGDKVDSVFQTFEQVSAIMEDYKNSNFTLYLRVNINEGEESLLLSTERAGRQKQAFTLDIIPHPEERSQRAFFLKEGYLSDMFEDGQLVDNVSFELSGKRGGEQTAFLYKGFFKRMSFTQEEMMGLQSALTGTQYQQIYDRFLIDPLSQKAEQIAEQKEIKELSFPGKISDKIKKLSANLRALRIFILSNPTFNNTQKVFNKGWNNWFMLRTLWYNVFYPHRLATLIFLPNYFRMAYGEKHNPTSWNGGNRPLLKNLGHRFYPSGREYLSALKEFEQQIIPIERMYLTASAKQAYLVALQNALQGESYDALLQAGLQKRTGNFGFLPSDDLTDKQIAELDFRDPSVSEVYQAVVSGTGQSKDKLKRSQSFYIELVQNKLFEESMRSYIQEQYGLTGEMSKREILNQIKSAIQAGEVPELRTETMQEVQERVRLIAKEKNVAEVVRNNMESWHKGLLEKLSIKHKKVMRNMLNPYKSIPMERYHVSNILGKDAEAMARASRYAGVRFLVDAPLELLILLLMMAGVTEGILKPLYSEAFSERAFFYMSVYLLWSGFFTGYLIQMLSAAWDKLYIDARQGFENPYGRLPKKEDLKKRFAAVRYFFNNSHSFGKQDADLKQNTLWENYKFGYRIILSNIPASIPTFMLTMVPFMGRFDVEVYVGGMFFFVLLPILALDFKIEKLYEISAGYASRHLMKLGVDVEKFLHHPVVRQILLKDAFKDRIRFNLINALTINNLLGNGSVILENMSAFPGSRVIHRAFFAEGHIITEYWDKLTEQTSKMFSGVSDFCKKAFTNRRLDDL